MKTADDASLARSDSIHTEGGASTAEDISERSDATIRTEPGVDGRRAPVSPTGSKSESIREGKQSLKMYVLRTRDIFYLLFSVRLGSEF